MDRWMKLFRRSAATSGEREAEPDSSHHKSPPAPTPAPSPAKPSPEQQRWIEFDMWCKRVTVGLMQSLASAATGRGKKLSAERGIPVEVVYPAQQPTDLLCAASEVTFMKVVVGTTEAHLYSARNPGKPPIIHLVSASEQVPPSMSLREGGAAAPISRRRITTRPICRVAIPRDGVGYVLVEPHAQETRLRMDDVVARLFDEVSRRR